MYGSIPPPGSHGKFRPSTLRKYRDKNVTFKLWGLSFPPDYNVGCFWYVISASEQYRSDAVESSLWRHKHRKTQRRSYCTRPTTRFLGFRWKYRQRVLYIININISNRKKCLSSDRSYAFEQNVNIGSLHYKIPSMSTNRQSFFEVCFLFLSYVGRYTGKLLEFRLASIGGLLSDDM